MFQHRVRNTFQILPYDLGARTKMDFNPNGLRFSMNMPMDNIVGSD